MDRTFASIDIGTNTFRLLISGVHDNKLTQKLLKRRITRLGGGFIPDRGLANESVERALATLIDFSQLINEYKVDCVRAVATSVVREAKNGPDFIRQVKDTTGINVDVIDGGEEALLALKGVLSCVDVKTENAIVFDIGGGSTEYILAHHDLPLYSESLKLGVVHATETFLKSDPPKRDELERIKAHVSDKLQPFIDNLHAKGHKKRLPPDNRFVTLVGTAGTITTLAAIDQGLESYDSSKINNYILAYEAVKRIFNLISPMPLAKRRGLKALEEGREDLIVAGTTIVLMTMEMFGFDRMTVSDGGLLEGVMIDMVARSHVGGEA